jgi:hypothetical protein
MNDKQIIAQLQAALEESQTALSNLEATHQAVLHQLAPLRALARAVALVDDVESQFSVDPREQCAARASLQKALEFYRESINPLRLAEIGQHFDRIALLRAADVLNKDGSPRMRNASLFLKERAKRGSSPGTSKVFG